MPEIDAANHGIVWRSILFLALASSLVAYGRDTPTSEKTISNRTEYNAYIAALNTENPQQKADAMEAFINQYPNSVVKIDAMEQAMQAYHQAGNLNRVRETAKRILQLDADNMRAFAIVTFLKRNDLTKNGETSAAKELGLDGERGLNALPKWHPADLSDAEFGKVKNQMAQIFYGAVAYSALQARDYGRARDYYLKSVPLDPTNLPDVWQLAIAELEMTPINPDGFWYAAKALNLARAQNSQPTEQIQNYAKAKYRTFHGSEDGWDKIVAAAESPSEPPTGFAVSIMRAAAPPEITPPALPPIADFKKEAAAHVGPAPSASTAIKLDSKDPKEYIRRGDAAYADNKFNEAIVNYTNALQLDPKSAQAFVKRAIVELDNYDSNGAMTDCDLALQIDSKNADAYATRARAKANKKDFGGAMADANRAIDLNNKSADTYAARCYVERRAGQAEAAIADGDRAVELGPKSALAYMTRAQAKHDKKDYDGAIKDIREAIALQPNNATAYNVLAAQNIEKGNWDEAIGAASRAIELLPNAVYYNNRAVAEDNKNDLSSSIADYTKAIELDGTNADYYRRRADVESEKKDWKAALADYTHVTELSPQDATAFCNRAATKLNTNDFAGAAADAGRAIELNPKYQVAYFWRGAARRRTGEDDGAIADIDRAIELGDKEAIAYVVRALAKADKRQFEAAIPDYNKAIELDPKIGRAHSGLGVARARTGDVSGGLADCNRGIELAPNESAVYSDRGVAEEEAKDFSSAFADFSKAIELDATDAVVYANRAEACINLKRFLDALTDGRRAVDLRPTAYNLEILGDVYVAIDQYSSALDAYERANRLESTQQLRDKIENCHGFIKGTLVPKSAAAPTIAPSTPSQTSYYGEQFPETRTRILSYQELSKWPESKLRYAINEIFARHGATFTDPKIMQQFSKFSWYHPNRSLTMDQIETALPYIEKANVTILGQMRTWRSRGQSRRR